MLECDAGIVIFRSIAVNAWSAIPLRELNRAQRSCGVARNPHIVLCVHGLSRNSRDFDRLAAELESDHRVVCMDVVGRGDSDWLADKSGYSFSTYLSDAASLIARVTTPVAGGLLESLHARLGGIDLWAIWDALICPVLVLRGAESEVLPRGTVEEMQRRKPSVKVVEFTGVGHVPALATRDQIEVVRDFLNAADAT